MALERLTQITEVGIQSGITLRNVNVEGAYVSGVVTATTLNVTGGGANFAGVVTATSFSGNVTGNITPTGLVVSGVSTFQASSFWGDGDVAYFGDGQDLLIFHNSTDSIIRDNGTGDLYIEGGNRIRLTNPTAIETYAVFNQDGAVELYYDNVKRLETSGIGVSVTSALTVGTGASISSPTTNVLALGTNNSERVRIDSSGNFNLVNTAGIMTAFKYETPALINNHFKSNSTISGDYVRLYAGGGTAQWDIYGNGENLRMGDNSSSATARVQFDNPTLHRSTATTNGVAALTAKQEVNNGGYLIFDGKNSSDTTVFSVTHNGRVAVSDGIDFSATTNSSGTMTSELLDDYEEGTFTPQIIGWTGTYSIQYGMYTKVGRMVTIQCEVQTNGGTGSFNTAFPGISNLPFARDNTTPSYRAMGVWGIIGTATYGANQIGAGLWDAHTSTTDLFPNNFTVQGGIGNFNGVNSANSFGYRSLIVYKTVT